MHLNKLLVYFETSPAIRLLRSPNAPFVVDVLHGQFKEAGRSAIPHSDLLSALSNYREVLQETDAKAFPQRAESYLADWCSPDVRWLRRTHEDGIDEPVYQLTPHTEDVFTFLDRVLPSSLGFVGTESRLKLIIDILADLVVGSSDDPETRLRHLRSERDRIDSEISQIEADGRVSRYQPAKIRERFATAVTLLRQLQGDFRAVEDSFRGITAQVQQRQVAGSDARGAILAFALDAEDLLKREDQGVSFYEFVRLILSPDQTEQLEEITEAVRRIPELNQQQEGVEAVRGMVSLLQSEALKVMRTNQRLSASLRRLLDSQAHAERQRIASLLRELRGLALGMAGDPPKDEVALTLDLAADIESPFRRSFWTPPSRFDAIELVPFEADETERMTAFQKLAALQSLDWIGMRQRIEQVLAVEHAPTLGELLERFPPAGGVIEVIGYVHIAREDGHVVEPAARETVVVPKAGPEGRPVAITLPLVTFVPDRRNGHAH
jgi:hypothetical protein